MHKPDRAVFQGHGRRRLVSMLGVTAFGITACGAPESGHDIASAHGEVIESASADRPAGPVALVVTESGLAGVPVGAARPRWTVDAAVAAPDGTAVFALRPGPGDETLSLRVVRIDPFTGDPATVGGVAAPNGTRVAAVEPGGDRIALVAVDRGSTVVWAYDTLQGRALTSRTFEGTLDPEAFSLDRTRVFAARLRGDYYNVHVLDLASGDQYPTLGPDKTKPPEDMYGAVVQAAVSPDGTKLATLYRDATKPGRTAFVHLLFLDSGSTFCIDLHAPFATAEPAARCHRVARRAHPSRASPHHRLGNGRDDRPSGDSGQPARTALSRRRSG